MEVNTVYVMTSIILAFLLGMIFTENRNLKDLEEIESEEWGDFDGETDGKRGDFKIYTYRK